jgi:peptide chain release factor 1
VSLHEALSRVEARFQELTDALSDPAVLSDPARLKKTAKERSSLEALIAAGRELRDVQGQIEGDEQILAAGDMELAELAEAELPGLRERALELERRVQTLLLPRDPNDDKSVVLEIRAGTGGEEAALFAGELFRLYQKYADRNGWKVEVLSSSPSELGGFKEIIASINGDGAYSKLKWESGVHRVQRVPATEAQGRIHTSAATVAVLPEAEDVDVEVKDQDIVVDVYRSGGPGGQGVNTTDSAVRIHHLPTGLIVTCQDERSQIKNRAKAMKVLRARLLDLQIRKEAEERARQRKEQVSTGDRSAKIRTYNFPQGRVTDHRIGLTLYRIDEVMQGGIDELVDGLVAADVAEKMREAGVGDGANGGARGGRGADGAGRAGGPSARQPAGPDEDDA